MILNQSYGLSLSPYIEIKGRLGEECCEIWDAGNGVSEAPGDSKSIKHGGWSSSISTWNAIVSHGGSVRSPGQDSRKLRETSGSKASMEAFLQRTSIQWASVRINEGKEQASPNPCDIPPGTPGNNRCEFNGSADVLSSCR